MALQQSRLLLILASLPLVGIFGYLWLKRKRNDEEDFDSPEQCEEVSSSSSIDTGLEVSAVDTPTKSYSRSLSGTTSTPIDIVVPRQLRSHKSAPVFISDEDLDLEIEKIKSMKNNYKWKEEGTSEAVKEDTKANVECSRPTLMPASPMEKASPSTSKMSPKSDKALKSAKSSPISIKSSPKSSSPKYKSPKVIKCTPQKTILSSSTSPKNQKQAKSVEEQFNSLNLSQQQEKPEKHGPNEENHVENEEMQRQTSSERDSANHSPCDVMLASPAPSSISDNQSEGSNDSGKGGSDVATPPSQTPANGGSISGDAADIPVPVIHQFAIPQHYVGRLIGRGGCIIQDIKSKSHTNLLVKKHPGNSKMKICVIEGTQMEVDNALHLIRERFPAKKYPEISLEQIFVGPPPLPPDQLGLQLIEGINNDTMVSFMMEPNRFFIQFPTHPSFPSLNILSTNMSDFYNNNETPTLPLPISDYTICACQLDGFWYRVMVTNTDTDTDTSHVTLLDYGGYYWVENTRLRQISGDFLLLPFQSTECILANVRPIGGGTWPKEAFDIAAELANRALACTQVADYTSNGIPLVYMYIVAGHQDIVFLNQELVDRGYAEWISYSQVESRTTART